MQSRIIGCESKEKLVARHHPMSSLCTHIGSVNKGPCRKVAVKPERNLHNNTFK
jgi:hypothetical protein